MNVDRRSIEQRRQLLPNAFQNIQRPGFGIEDHCRLSGTQRDGQRLSFNHAAIEGVVAAEDFAVTGLLDERPLQLDQAIGIRLFWNQHGHACDAHRIRRHMKFASELQLRSRIKPGNGLHCLRFTCV